MYTKKMNIKLNCDMRIFPLYWDNDPQHPTEQPEKSERSLWESQLNCNYQGFPLTFT